MENKRTTYCVVQYAVNQTSPGWHWHTTSELKATQAERGSLQTFVSAHGCQGLVLRREGQTVPAAR